MKTRNVIPGTGTITAATLALALAHTAVAEQVTVQISKRGAGKPVEAAAVCLGTPANPSQFGAQLADENGVVQFDKVHILAPLVLTVSKSGYQGRQVALGTAQHNRGVLLTLASGGGGPECAEAVALLQPVPSAEPRSPRFKPGIENFRINGGEAATESPRVTLNYTLTGEASHYRVSERSDFAAVEWQPITPEVRYDLAGGSGSRTVYFQVGKLMSAEGAEIEILSNVAADTIVLTGG
ncbi:MAG: hypothetical protein GWN21_18865 [Gammaproteobacteria bacterium]|nr:hypothetical protein [Gammaproteobacteria bacterium]NIR25086.1 hypothetical protein [Gammaproteobacteria bacterium]NIS06787.1 hypothetical protein [Gammaproteobacteria bacterium]NIU41417.1 hypothetical protein [Gammaproteobacteria bacterium]NIV49860.1 hypothetical protein [Gammaproteobacteria bacterium]